MSKKVAVDLAKVYDTPTKEKGRKLITTLAWGDEVELLEETDKYLKVELKSFKRLDDGSIEPDVTIGFITPTSSSKVKTKDILADPANVKVLKVDYVDVQQGDGAVIETPSGKVILVDGGDNQLFARYLAGRYAATTDKKPKTIECILVTHGDADHFSGLVELYKSELPAQTKAWKKIFIKPNRIYHNGLVKRPSTKNGKDTRDIELLGDTKEENGELYITGLETDLLKVPDTQMNLPFRDWKKALAHYKKRNDDLKFERLDHLSNANKPFAFMDRGIKVDVLCPITTPLTNKNIPSLKFLSTPSKLEGTRQVVKAKTSVTKGSYSASHTINGHSFIFKMTYGNANFLFCGDLNEEAEDILVTKTTKEGILFFAQNF